ncbi:MAG: methionyl-tRNA formyltransferase [Actinobacteria bacterium]|nr:methionyl-tRNA formyltransferase [Actinomycetota bacterium]
MKIVFLGSDAIATDCLARLADSPHELVAVVTQPDRPAGRGRKPRPTAIRQLAQQLDLKTLALADVNAPPALEQIANSKPDLLVTFAFNQKFGSVLLRTAPAGAINVHPSLLPAYRGAAPVARALLNGDRRTGLSIIRMTENLDAGDILAQQSYDIDPEHTTGSLEKFLGQQSAPLVLKVVEQIAAGTVEPRPQDHTQATIAPKIKKAEARLDFFLSAHELLNYIRAFTPWPGAFAFFHSQASHKSERVVITWAVADYGSADSTVEPGMVLPDLSIQCGQGVLKIAKIKPAGGREMPWQDFVNGRRLQPGDRITDHEC